MKTKESGSQSVAFTVNNGSRQFDQNNCPPGIRPAVEQAIRRGQERSGTVVGGGLLWHWEAGHGRLDTVRLQLEGEREEFFGSLEIPRSKWESFANLAKLRGMTAADFLISVLAEFIQRHEDVGYEEAVALLFGEHHEEKVYFAGPAPEIQRFEAACERFHNGGIQ